ncbi:hypothetical protein GFY24_16010 [Nocardia sp. SYP-A9097]|uniref:hypothetical protein n=1 Tax=Nocardia sp. SYP-A9097 TaxID=2663237 RepID=UPI00129B2207|nr:hypothetical protein [Nocardia sp. SYP-A9097]MRH88932.1 hypothetical protein [Nocardia sp. SYP-A9097]
MPDIRRYTGVVEATSAFLGAVIAGLLLMAPLDLAWADQGPLKLDLLILNMPRAAAAGAMFAVIAAALAVALGRRTAWIAAFGSAVILLADHVWSLNDALTESLVTVNYVDSIFGGILLGALAVAVFGRPIATPAFLIGALSSILIGDLTSLPTSSGSAGSLVEWAASGTPPLWMVALAVPALAAGAVIQRAEPKSEEADGGDLPIGPILSALFLVGSTAVSTEWLVKRSATPMEITLVAAGMVAVAALAALLLPGRDGAVVLTAVAVANSGSAIIAVPRPDWSAPLPLFAVVAGYYAGRKWGSPLIGLFGSAALGVFAAFTAGLGRADAIVPLLGIAAVGALLGYCFADAADSRSAVSTVVALAMLLVPCLVVALRGSSFARVAYSPRWYRDPTGVTSAVPGWVSVAISLGCVAGLALLYRLRPPGHLPKRPSTQFSASV